MKKLLFLVGLAFSQASPAQKILQTDVLIIGGGTGGTAAGIQSARLGANTIIAESGPWLGGMISAAGVSAVDGNHRLPSGLWAEFRNHLYKVYGGPAAVETGWVSNTLFEPHIADSIFKKMAADEKLLTVLFNHGYSRLIKKANRIEAVVFTDKKSGQAVIVKAKTFVDATELGDVMKHAGVPYDLGMESGKLTGERVGVMQTNDIVQDLTYVAILKDYGQGTDKSIPKPANYNPAEFDAACTDYYKNKQRKAPSVDAVKMLEYGKLPNGKYMINWPIYGNDTYLNVVEMPEARRQQELVKAKETTRRFVYFIQQELGFKHLGLADDEFPTQDKLALMPYHREGRRLKGLVRFTMRHIAEPFTYGNPLYRTGISVGDYPIDHHHKKNLKAPQHLEFYPIPSYNIPLGALIPQQLQNLVVAEKSISVSNVANGTTRLQPVVLLTGQAAGTLAALSVLKKQFPNELPVRMVQESLLKSKAYILPYIDVTPDHPHWEAVQKIGATGILRGTGIPYKWANQTWFYPDSLVNGHKLEADLKSFVSINYNIPQQKELLVKSAVTLCSQLAFAFGKKSAALTEEQWKEWGLTNFDLQRPITRLELAVLLQHTADPFGAVPVNHHGLLVKPGQRKVKSPIR